MIRPMAAAAATLEPEMEPKMEKDDALKTESNENEIITIITPDTMVRERNAKTIRLFCT